MICAAFKDKSGNEIAFDDYNIESCIEDEHKTIGVEICTHCYNKYKNILGDRPADTGSIGMCFVVGCNNDADYYVDFKAKEIEIKVI